MIVLQASKHYDYVIHLASKKNSNKTKTYRSDVGFYDALGKQIVASKKSIGVRQINDDVLTDAIIKFYSNSNKYYDPYKISRAGVKLANDFNFYQEFGTSPIRAYKLFDSGSKLVGILRDLDIISGGKNVLEDLAENMVGVFYAGSDRVNEFMLSPEFEVFEGMVGATLGIAPLLGHIAELAAIAAKATSGALAATTVIGVIRAMNGLRKNYLRMKEYEGLVDKDRINKRIEAVDKIEATLASYKGKDQIPDSLRKELNKFFVEEEMEAKEYFDLITQVERDYKKVGILRKATIRKAKEEKQKKEKEKNGN